MFWNEPGRPPLLYVFYEGVPLCYIIFSPSSIAWRELHNCIPFFGTSWNVVAMFVTLVARVDAHFSVEKSLQLMFFGCATSEQRLWQIAQFVNIGFTINPNQQFQTNLCSRLDLTSPRSLQAYTSCQQLPNTCEKCWTKDVMPLVGLYETRISTSKSIVLCCCPRFVCLRSGWYGKNVWVMVSQRKWRLRTMLI